MSLPGHPPTIALSLLLSLASAVGTLAAQAPPESVTYRHVAGQALRLDLFRPAPAATRPRAILLFHGGGWSTGGPEWTHGPAREFATWGLAAIAVQYRLSVDRTTPLDALDDVCAAFAWVRAHADSLRLTPRLAGYGVSAGGQLVAATSTVGCPNGDPGPEVLLLLSPALDLERDRWFASLLRGRATVAALSPVEHVRATTAPTSIVQGAADVVTPVAGAERYCWALRRHRRSCAIHLYPRLGHLLTRKLGNQESDFDPDPAARADGQRRHREFLGAQGFLPPP